MIKEMLFVYYQTQCLYLAVELGIADQLVGGAQSVDRLAKMSGVCVDELYRVMRYLVAKGVFEEERELCYYQAKLLKDISLLFVCLAFK